MTEFPHTPDVATTNDDERPWSDLVPVDDTDRIDDRVLAEATERDAIDQRRDVPLDDPDEER
ncbi:MAG: hypothetical protein R2713_02170 [Ilumatobacteraceae bacterium]|nr:hypothetical protein [Acidimicrobiales bacterium]MCB9394321.1 hypothetical protein [Acidimicrobiaceae bacterium]